MTIMLKDISYSAAVVELLGDVVNALAQRSNSRQLFRRPAEILTGDKIAQSNWAPQELGI